MDKLFIVEILLDNCQVVVKYGRFDSADSAREAATYAANRAGFEVQHISAREVTIH